MVHQPECGTNTFDNTPYIIDYIRLNLSPRLLDSNEIRSKYLDKGLSVGQIAKLYRVSKSMIRARLHDMGIRDGDKNPSRSNLNPDNYRCPVAPYGYQVVNGKLVTNKQELVICRIVVELVEREGWTHTEVARELGRRGFKTRVGKLKWDSKTIFNIFKRWKGKL